MPKTPSSGPTRATTSPNEYSVDELARVTGATVRNIRAYQDRGLLSAPAKRGRTAVYDDTHVARLKLVNHLLARGHTLANACTRKRNMKTFDDKVAAITGAGSGIGRALAVLLAREGCHLSLSDVDARGLEQTAALADTAARTRAMRTVRIETRVVDVADRAAMIEWARATNDAHGRVNLVFNNAGVALSSTVEGMAYDDLEWIVSINFWGVVHGAKAFLPYLKASGDGHIVNMSSVFGLFAQPGMSAYNATKFAVRGFTESLREELDLMRCGVSATCVHPGGIRTNIARASRISPNMFGFLIENGRQGREDFERFFITTPEQAAGKILYGVRRNRRRVLIGRDARAADWMARLLPSAYQSLVVRTARRLRQATRERARRARAAATE